MRANMSAEIATQDGGGAQRSASHKGVEGFPKLPAKLGIRRCRTGTMCGISIDQQEIVLRGLDPNTKNPSLKYFQRVAQGSFRKPVNPNGSDEPIKFGRAGASGVVQSAPPPE